MTVALYAAKFSASRLSRRGRGVRGTRSGAMIFSWMSCASLFVIESLGPSGVRRLCSRRVKGLSETPFEEFLSFDCRLRTKELPSAFGFGFCLAFQGTRL